ncbi:rhodanese-related sulfurtransferase [Buchnera aphidicola]|uniref:oxygen-dependent tRNA uridine(34) hydroxylase TrhO n=1 Tax=Buchnera aphidicola TaxID=9 RepID=UPI00094C8F38|nr:rhodanese-related sulfurtransferase [Buchnera aphidicola]
MYKKTQLISNTCLENVYSHYSCKKRIVLSFYKYFIILDPKKLCYLIKLNLEKKNILGRIYISEEGINALISIPFFEFSYIKHFFKCIHIKTKKMYMNASFENKKETFFDLRVKVKKQIISSQINNFYFNNKKRGIYLNAYLINKYILYKSCVLVDMRNSYEYEIGHFFNSITVPAQTFREQLKKIPKYLHQYKEKKVILYCTGGIRCEKATALLRNHGFSQVYHIYGGILCYLTQVKKYNLRNYFQGKVFVFDARLAKKVTNKIFSKCISCNQFTDRVHINCFNNFCHRLFIQCKVCSIKFDSCCSEKCQKKLFL